MVFGLGWGATHHSLPFAAAVLAAIQAAAPTPVLRTTRALESQPSPGQAELAGLILKLGELRDAGLLSEEEFQAKKAELLSRM